jgi:signal transduction histidine kinase/CheY-like chemotaxis protein
MDGTEARPGAGPAERVRRLWRDAPLRRKLLVAVSLPVIWLVPTGVAAAVVQGQQADVRLRVRAENQAQAALADLERSLLDAETGMRGFIATDDPAFLEPYEAASRERRRARDDLERALGDDASDADDVERAAAAAAAAVISLVDAAPPSGSLRTAALEAAKERMDVARAEIADLDARIAADLATHRARSDQLAGRASLVVVSGLAVGTIAGLISLLIVSTGIANRVTAVERNARRLAEGEPLEEQTPSRDELGRMTDELVRTSLLLQQRAADMAQSRDEAVRATRAKDRFLSRMSHELRTPLTSILGFGQLLQMEDLAPDDRAAVDQIVRSGRHLLDLINEVLDVARIESGHLSLSIEPLDLDAVVADCVSLMAPQAEAAGVTVRWSGAARVVADQQRTKQVVLNLLSNAVKYNGAEMLVTIGVEHTGTGTVRLSVTDTGMGIGDADQARLFQPFERLGAGATDIEGTGVGLALTRTLVEAMGGTIGVISERGRGSTFWVELPAVAGDEPGAAAGPALADPTAVGLAAEVDDGTPVVVYVDDNRANIELVERIFQTRPERLVTAMQGAAARELARRHRPVAMLVDLHLPDIGGEDLVRLLRADPATRPTPIIVLTADTSGDKADMLQALGVEHLLPKPLDLAALDAALADVLAGSGRG